MSIGGGTGLSCLLSGLKAHVGEDGVTAAAPAAPWVESLTAVVTVTDDGGSSGRLREEFQILPPGDIRNCMAALAEDERLLTQLFQYRFKSEGDLAGHSFGNLFLTALTGVTGDFFEAIKVSSEVLAIKGRIFPSTVEDVALVAELADGRTIQGESKIVAARTPISHLRLSHPCRPLAETLDAIAQADLITIGPGSLYTSIIPNLLVDDIVAALNRSSAMKAYICNIMTQPGETDGFTVEDHLNALFEHSPALRLDYVIANAAPIHAALRDKYLADGAVQVEFTARSLCDADLPVEIRVGEAPHVRSLLVMCDNLVSEHNVVRHDPLRLAQLLLNIHQRHLTPPLSFSDARLELMASPPANEP
ncbi:MAG TPA: uridine diphosphate-N-acetylglucosamine-binding protein YvcK [Blastocatellia bacterium]|nr:uridine diphosphate-N-acetylglucosamine-binding protein YvcK [Blastocatellia bacterium]